MPRMPFKETIGILQKKFEAVIKDADELIPEKEQTLDFLKVDITLKDQIQAQIAVLVDARIRARDYLRVITDRHPHGGGIETPEPEVNRITMEPPSPEPTSGGANA